APSVSQEGRGCRAWANVRASRNGARLRSTCRVAYAGRRACRNRRTSPRHQFRLGLSDRLVEHQKDQGTARERFHHGQENRLHALVISIRGVPVFGGPASKPADSPLRIRYLAIRPWLVGDRKFAMITKFDSLYAGHTDLDNIGYGGTPINER